MTDDTAPNRHKRPTVRSNTLHVRLEPQLCDAVIDAASHRGMSSSEWARQALRTCAMLEGTLKVDTPSRDAGTLYDRVDGRQRWALIQGDAIVGLHYHAEKPTSEREGDVWVPVVHRDSEPFDLATHWRLPPRYTLIDVYGTHDRVIVTFPVVLKSVEEA
ncbi:hypothetical protein [Bradyrhizobium sp. Bra78]|uniref:hypothetical protein n=1 Tax=Bradyrhizobium sp. Bra78 TaxID=2926010 RepID=UPI0021C8C379|nr:hypothetical protein [Bradyrhizobium sp. Bra78]